ncbi:permease [Marinomonas ostreistagni]|nr:permease [Marinomonas ostreistagni]
MSNIIFEKYFDNSRIVGVIMMELNSWQAALDFFISAFTELAVLFVLISILVSAMNLYLPKEKVSRLLSGNRGYGVAMGLGAMTPFCSCSTLPMLIGLIQARASFGPMMAFLITSPLLNPFVISLFWITFSPQVTLLYAACVVILAALSGWSLQRLNFQTYIRSELLTAAPSPCGSGCDDSGKVVSKSATCSTANCNEAPKIIQASTLKMLTLGALKQLREMLPYMIFGVAIGALLHGFVPLNVFEGLAMMNVFLLIPLSAVIGIFLYVRASTMIPIAASLMTKGLSAGAVISLTIAGAGASLPEMIMLRKMFRWPLLITFVFVVLLTAMVTGFAIELVVGSH